MSDKCRKALEAMRQYSADHGVTTFESKMRGLSVSNNHNELCDKIKGEWILIVGYDHTFEPDALMRMLAVVDENPDVKILMGAVSHCDLPNRLVGYNWDVTGEQLLNIVPFRDFHPGQVQAGGILEVAAVGSGFTLYHRELFSIIPPPWFERARLPTPKRLMDKLLDYKHMEYVAENGNSSEYVKELADVARAASVRNAYPLGWGPDMGFCLKAKEHGFGSFIHFGTVVYHYDWVPITPNQYVEYLKQGRECWEQELFGGQEMTVEGVENARQFLDTMDEAQKTAEREFQEEMRKREAENKEPEVVDV